MVLLSNGLVRDLGLQVIVDTTASAYIPQLYKRWMAQVGGPPARTHVARQGLLFFVAKHVLPE